MWTIKDKKIFSLGREARRLFVENEHGTRVIFLRFDGFISEGMEVFEYCDAREAFQFWATRLDRERRRTTDTYTVWLGGALGGASITRPNAFLDADYVRRIASDIRRALTTWSSRPNAVARG